MAVFKFIQCTAMAAALALGSVLEVIVILGILLGNLALGNVLLFVMDFAVASLNASADAMPRLLDSTTLKTVVA